MSILLRLSFSFVILVPALVHAATLENPANGSFYSGIGVISGWKCMANGPLTVRFNGGASLPLAYGNARADVRNAGACRSAQVGFVSIMNWAELGDGTHTAVVYDNNVEFARSTFTVATTGESYVTGAEGECRVPDFPAPGETMPFAWNEATQHLEMVNQRGGSGSGGEDAPGVPRNVRVTEVGEELVVVEWDPPTGGGAVSYNLYYRSPNGPEESLGNVSTLGSRVSGSVVPGECYRVTAVNAAGVEGEKSPEVCVWMQQSPDGGGGDGGPAALENPATGSFYSGLGVISGWKCEATGPLTVRFNNGVPLPLAYGNVRADVRNAGACPSAEVGFVSIMNWAELSDGEHTAVVYDDGVEFARSTFTVATTGEPYVTGAEGECRVPDFPTPGETMPFAWNEATQHLEMVEESETDGDGGTGSGADDHGDTEEDMTEIVFVEEHGSSRNHTVKRIYGTVTEGDRDMFLFRYNKYARSRLFISVPKHIAFPAPQITVNLYEKQGNQWLWIKPTERYYDGSSLGGTHRAHGYRNLYARPGTERRLEIECARPKCLQYPIEYQIIAHYGTTLMSRYNAGDPTVVRNRCKSANSYTEGIPELEPCDPNREHTCRLTTGDGVVIQECIGWGDGGTGDDGGGGSGDDGGLCGQNPHDVCTDIWTGDPRDGQSKAICQSACAYATQCHDEGVRINCANLRRLDELNNTDYGIRNCSVCQ